jgi:hypothetical protein
LAILLGLDACLDVLSLIRLNKKWHGWALVPRLLIGIGYLAVFMAFLGLSNIFPFGYTYWDLEPGYSGPMVYLFLWLLG